jgi:predicted DNA-binding transcriptional regulator YafY
MEVSALKTERLLGILCILAETDRITVRELADRFEVSKRTIFRDINALGKAGIPITSRSGTGGGVSVVKGYKIDRKILSEDDAVKVFTALSGLKSIDGDTSVSGLIAKLVPGKEGTVFSRSDYVIDLSSWFCDSPVSGKLADLHGAVTSHRCIRLEYISGSGRTFRVVEPHKLVFKQSDWYLYAYCRERSAFRLFKLGRMASFEILEESFRPRPVGKIDLESGCGAELFPPDNGTSFFEVILEYDACDEFALTDRIDASFMERDPGSDRGRIRFRASDPEWTADLVFGLSGKVRVIAPPFLKDMVETSG